MQIPPKRKHWGITFDVVSPRFLQDARKQETAVHLWTMNEKDKIGRFIDMGVDGIITDYPDRALQILGRLPEKRRQKQPAATELTS